MDKKKTRYMSGFINYKTVSCRMTEYEDKIISEYCRRNNISKSLLLNSAAMYCINNRISVDELLNNTVNETNYDYKDMIGNDK